MIVFRALLSIHVCRIIPVIRVGYMLLVARSPVQIIDPQRNSGH